MSDGSLRQRAQGAPAPASGPIEVRPRIRAALEDRVGVVALESSVIAHGLPDPHGLGASGRMELAVRGEGAVPATIAVLGGRVVVGLEAEEIVELANAGGVAKASTRDLAALAASGRPGATTVAATAFVAGRAGIAMLATGGIGGVHRGAETSLDVSADLAELGRTPVGVVCSGAKAVLDLRRTLEVLETMGVTVVGYETDELPAFYARESGLRLDHRVDSPAEAARLVAAQRGLGVPGSILFCHPPPPAAAMDRAEVEEMVAGAAATAEAAGIRGAAVTPFLLDLIGKASGGRALAANLALLEANARLAARIAVAYAKGEEAA